MVGCNHMITFNRSKEDGLDDVKQMLKIEYDNTHQRLRGVLKSFEDNCQNYINKADGPMLRPGQGIGKTDLDKYRIRMCKNKVVRNQPILCLYG